MTRSSSSTPSPTSPSPSASPSGRSKAEPHLVRVNLIPKELAESIRARRVTRVTIGAVLLFVGVLAAGYALRLVEVAQAEVARDDAQWTVAALENELSRLDEYAKLVERLDTRNTLLASAMEKEIAFSHVLSDLSLNFPASASLKRLTVNLVGDGELAMRTSEIDVGQPVAQAKFEGYTLEEYAPGVETVLLDVDRIPAFYNPFLTTGATSEIGGTEVTEFNGTVLVDSDAYTGRYADGVPPEDTP